MNVKFSFVLSFPLPDEESNFVLSGWWQWWQFYCFLVADDLIPLRGFEDRCGVAVKTWLRTKD